MKREPIELFMPPNMLKAKAGSGPGGLDMAAVKRAEQAMETSEDALPVLRRDGGTVVGDMNRGPGSAFHPHGDAPALVGIAHGIVQQIVQQLAQAARVALHPDRRIRAFEAQVDAALERFRHPGAGRLERELGQVERLERHRVRRLGLVAGEHLAVRRPDRIEERALRLLLLALGRR